MMKQKNKEEFPLSKKHINRRSRAFTVFLWTLLVVYLLVLLRVILFKFPLHTILDILSDRDELEYTRVNMVPFQTIRFYMFSGRVSFRMAARNLLGNILAFVPLGILIPLLRRKLSIPFTFATAFAISAAIELIQLRTGLGSCDIDDIILNVFGAMLTCIVLSSIDGFVYVAKKVLQGMENLKNGIDKKREKE